MVKRRRILITGRVQGVGFRPRVYNLAVSLDLTGQVHNDSRGVTIEIQGEESKLAEFVERLKNKDRPTLAEIKKCEVEDIAIVESEKEFVIKTSEAGGEASSEVTADIATCGDCLKELFDKKDFRFRYPFINCTNCGPRYSIVKTIPYDRCNTTMADFEMCGKCGEQYRDVRDRRFHAQPVACGTCGPRVWLADNKGEVIEDAGDIAIAKTIKLLKEGKIAGIKGLGGFHLACDGLNNEAVRKLRERKRRDHKPFALMAANIETIRKYAVVSEKAEKVLTSPVSPIVLLLKKEGAKLADAVAGGVNTYGFMLCYTPVHYLLFAEGLEVLVMTSGNISDEPLICDNDKAVERLGAVADVFLMHDREIYRQVDDSIVHFIDGQAVVLRRSRGYVPRPFVSERKAAKQVFAAGGDMKNTFCFAKGNQLVVSEHIGDLEDAEVYRHYAKSVEHFRGLFEAEPEVVVYDLHPGYFSTQYAEKLTDVEKLQVQHHWAHIAAVLAENEMDGPVIGLAVDGTGYGEDGAIWGCECLIASLKEYERFGHLDYYKLAGADAASKEAIRPVTGLLKYAYGDGFDLNNFDAILGRIEPDIKKQQVIAEQIEKGINTVETSSMGRVFDAVAAMAGLGNYNNFEAQLPMALEAIIKEPIEEAYEFEITECEGEPSKLDLREMVRGVVEDVQAGVEARIISVKFHNCIAASLCAMAQKARNKTGLDTAAISGGVFCNRYLTNRLIKLLKSKGFNVLFNKDVPSNDGCVSLGQIAIAVARRS